MKTPDLPEEKPSALDKRDSIIADSRMTRLQAGEIVGALHYPKADRPLFSASRAVVRDALPCVRPSWRRINERHVDGVRTRQEFFKTCPREGGLVDPTLVGLVLLAVVGAGLMFGILE